jgi:hypothetical protein
MISELQLDYLPGKSTFVKGIAGISKAIAITGVIRFESSKLESKLMSVSISFRASLKTHLSVSGCNYSQNENLFFDQTMLLGDNIKPVKTEKGAHALPFELIIHEPWLIPNYESPKIGKSSDGAVIEHLLQVDLTTLHGFFGNKRKTSSVTAIVDIPCIPLTHALSALNPQSLFNDGVVDDIQVHVETDTHVVYLGSILNVTVDTSGSHVFEMTAELVQSEIIHAQGQVREFDYILATGTHPSLYKVQDGRWRSQIKLTDAHIKAPQKLPYKSLNVVSPINHSNLMISHKLKITIGYKIGKEKRFGFIDVPITVLNLDQETLEWVGKNTMEN